ncbi:MAG: outer membrane beta-barrel domain-containing protein [Deltaproteobacteria bacterium]|nr:outer membrane beta-barrel domain-containing protein [Deltaproteobacteria bacterium]
MTTPTRNTAKAEGHRALVSRRLTAQSAVSIAVGMVVAVSTGRPALADDADELKSGRVIAVQERPYRMVHEFSVAAGTLPLDALYTGYTLGGSYTLHLSDLWAWEAISFHYSANAKTGLEDDLASKYSVAPTSNPEIEYLVGSNLVITPLIGKLTLLNENIIHAAAFLSVGGGLTHFSDGFRPQASIGPGIRLFLGQVVSTRLDIRASVVPDIPSGIDVILHITLGVSFNFGSVRATEGASEEVVDSTTGFEDLDELYPLSNPALGRNAKPSETP